MENVQAIILPKWILSYTFFDENIILRIINDASDAAYFPIINSYSDLNFSNSYSETITDLKLISFPHLCLQWPGLAKYGNLFVNT